MKVVNLIDLPNHTGYKYVTVCSYSTFGRRLMKCTHINTSIFRIKRDSGYYFRSTSKYAHFYNSPLGAPQTISTAVRLLKLFSLRFIYRSTKRI